MTKKIAQNTYQQDIKIPKPIKITAKILQAISTKWATKFTVKLFGTPIKYRMPEREWHMDKNTIQQNIIVPTIQKEIVVYSYGEGNKKILLVHGWSGRGTQMVKIAEALLKQGFQVISFDAPGHGKAPKNQTHMGEFIESVFYLEKQFGPFQAAIGHSLGGMTLLNATANNLQIKKLIVIGSGDIVSHIVRDFVKALELKPCMAKQLQAYYKNKIGREMDDFSASVAAKKVSIPVLVVHDENDADVPISAAENIYKHLKNGEILITKSLGHKKILGNGMVIDAILDYIKTP